MPPQPKKSLTKRTTNRLLHLLARNLPGASNFRPLIHSLRGVKIYGTVFIGDEVYLENEFPELIEIHDQASINVRATVLAHFRESCGKVVLEKNVRIGPHCVVAASESRILTVGQGSVLAAGTVLTRSVPPFRLFSGVPAKPIAKITVPLTLENSYQEFKKGLVPILPSRSSSAPNGEGN